MGTFSFDDSEFESGPEKATTQSVDSVVAELRDPQPEQGQDLDALDQEVETRFEIALYYRALLKDTLFNEPSDAARVVEAEVRAFIRDRLETLLGMKQPKQAKVESVFNPDEVAALKAVASKLLGKPSLMESKPRPQPPSVRKAQAPAPIQTQARTEVVMPTLKAKKPTQSAMSAPKSQVDVIPLKDEWTDADVGKFVIHNGVKYQLVKNDLGTIYKKDVTERVTPANAIPMPNGKQAIEAVLAAQAARQVQMATDQPLFGK